MDLPYKDYFEAMPCYLTVQNRDYKIIKANQEGLSNTKLNCFSMTLDGLLPDGELHVIQWIGVNGVPVASGTQGERSGGILIVNVPTGGSGAASNFADEIWGTSAGETISGLGGGDFIAGLAGDEALIRRFSRQRRLGI